MYLIFNNEDSRELGIDLEVIGWSRPLLPDSRDELVFVEGQDGSRLNKKPLGNRPITVSFRAFFSNEDERLEVVERLTRWLYSEDFERLILSDESDVYYLAKILDGTDLEPELFRAEFSITFTCQPLKYGENKIEEKESTEGTIEVDGTYKTPPITTFTLTEDTNLLEFELNGEKIVYESAENPLQSGDKIRIDTQEKEFRVNEELKVLEVEGYFVYLNNGKNHYSISASCNNISIEWQELYLFKVGSL